MMQAGLGGLALEVLWEGGCTRALTRPAPLPPPRRWKQRLARPALAFPVIVAIMLFPIGLFTGAFTQLNVALCGSSGGGTAPYGSGTSFYCSDNWFATLLRNLVTGFLPSVLLSVYQAVVLPLALYSTSQSEAGAVSLVELDFRCGSLFFYWNVFNYFLGALLGGSLLAGIRAFLDNPSEIWSLLGQVIPASSKCVGLGGVQEGGRGRVALQVSGT